MKFTFVFLLILILFTSCDSTKLKETPISQFEGKWKLINRGMLEGIEIDITKDKKGKYSGKIIKLNDDKYVNMFCAIGDKFVFGISRNSNFEFTLSEKKIAAPLFSQYGISSSADFEVVFLNQNTISFGKNGSEGTYERL